MRLRHLCCVLSISLLSHPIHASSDPRIIASYLNWDIALFYDQNVKSCVAISKGNPYEHKEEEEVMEEEMMEEEMMEEEVMEEEMMEEEVIEEVIEEEIVEEEVIEEAPLAIGGYDFGIEAEPEVIAQPESIEPFEYEENLHPYEFGPFTDEIIIPSNDDEEIAQNLSPAEQGLLELPDYNVEIAKIPSQSEQKTANEDSDPNIVVESEQEPPEEIAPEEIASEQITEIDTEKLLAEAKAEADKKNIKKGAFFITNWPQRSEYFDISIRPQALLETGKTAWLLFPDNSRFVLTQSKLDAKPNPYLRAEILKRLRQNRFAEVVNYDQNGEQIRHYYDLQGINYALSALLRFCPLPHYPE
ncbi:MAG: hypothetical protein K0U45_00340 [Alphaproteobacteria bacterium]|nr:hypothetical protein [Alphaproteobacteria bacterium]